MKLNRLSQLSGTACVALTSLLGQTEMQIGAKEPQTQKAPPADVQLLAGSARSDLTVLRLRLGAHASGASLSASIEGLKDHHPVSLHVVALSNDGQAIADFRTVIQPGGSVVIDEASARWSEADTVVVKGSRSLRLRLTTRAGSFPLDLTTDSSVFEVRSNPSESSPGVRNGLRTRPLNESLVLSWQEKPSKTPEGKAEH